VVLVGVVLAAGVVVVLDIQMEAQELLTGVVGVEVVGGLVSQAGTVALAL
jgi:hypothetical protein